MSTRKKQFTELGILQEQMQLGVHQRILRSIIRWNLTILLYYYYWQHALVRWSLVFVLPVVLFNLLSTIYLYISLRRQIQDVENKLD